MNNETTDLRRALGCFATGIAVVTAANGDSTPIGMTVSSFSSVSLEPPLILWSVGDDARNAQRFVETDFFAVNVLAHDQQPLAERFAQTTGQKFSGVAYETGLGGAPKLDGCVACFECRTQFRYPGGDHTIIVGRVVEFSSNEAEPLIYCRSRYRS